MRAPFSMFSILSIVIAVAWSFVAGGCAPVPAEVDAGSVRAAIDDSNRLFMAAATAGDGGGVAERYSDDATLLPPNGEQVEGREAIREFWDATLSAGVSAARLEAVEVEAPSSDTAIEIGRYQLEAGGVSADEGKYLVVWKRVDGNWRMYRDIWNSSRPPAEPPSPPSGPPEP